MKFTAAALSATLAALVGSTVAQDQELKILAPGGDDLWWVAQSDNVVSWTCKTSPYQQFTVLIANKDQNILTSPQAFIAQQNNFDCSKLITKDQVNQQPAKGYTIQLADVFNSSHVYAESAEFEIKPIGSTYPATSATPTQGGSATGSATGSNAAASGSSTATGGNNNGAGHLSASGGLAAALAAVGLMFA